MTKEQIMKEKRIIKAKCSRCLYEWNTESDMYLVSCPSCNDKVQIRKLPNKKEAMAEVRRQ